MGLKTPQEAAAKWQARVSTAQPDYQAGISKPRRDWATAAMAGEAAYAEGVQKALSAGSRAAGIQRAGTSKWQQNAIRKAPRWIDGVRAAAPAYGAGITRVINAANQIVPGLTQRGAAGSDANIQRSVEFQRGMHQAAQQWKGAGASGGAIGPTYGATTRPFGAGY